MVGGDTLFDSTAHIDEPAYRRRIGYVFQDGRLFPHMSVARNLDYGRWMSGTVRDDAQLARVVDLLDIASLLKRRRARCPAASASAWRSAVRC
ncbi:MAG: hypothetical protein WDN48_16405 [Pseudolabrys sp.]